jgi:hypothetical protein
MSDAETLPNNRTHPDETATSLDHALALIRKASRVCVLVQVSPMSSDCLFVSVSKAEAKRLLTCPSRGGEAPTPSVELVNWDEGGTCYVGTFWWAVKTGDHS